MKKISYLFLCCMLIYTQLNALTVGYSRVFSSSATQKWIGYPNSSGTPSSPVGSYTDYGTTDADRVYVRRVTATENGTAQAISFRVGTDNGFGDDAWVVLYNGTTLIGYAAIGTQTAEAWTSYLTLTAASGQDLDFGLNDELNFWVCWDSASGADVSRDSSGASGVTYYTSGEPISTAPPATVSAWSSSANAGPAVILRYVER